MPTSSSHIIALNVTFAVSYLVLNAMETTIKYSACPGCSGNAISKVLVCKDYTVSHESFEIWECASCRLRFTQNAPSQEAIGPYYDAESYISHTDSEKGLVNKLYQTAREYTLGWKIKLVNHHTGQPGRGKQLLDIGAGTGAFLQRAIREKWAASGVEPDAGARNICLEKYQLVLEKPDRLFELPPATFDAVTMWHVLEHVHQLHSYLQEIKRILKPGGTAFIALPNYDSADARDYGSYWAAYDVPRHLYHFNPVSFKALADFHKLTLERIEPMWLDAFYIALLSEKYKRGKTSLVAAGLSGLKSNWGALKDPATCSSLVYILKNI